MTESAVPSPAPETERKTQAVSETTGLARNFAAGIAMFFPLIGGIVFLVLEKKDAFVRFYAMQSVYFGGLLFAVSLAVTLAELIFRQVPLIGWLVAMGFLAVNLIFSLAWVIIWIVAVVKALSNMEWEVPVLGALARRRLNAAPATPS